MSKQDQALILREQASQQLAQIKTIESGTEYLSKVKGIEAWAKAEKQDADMMTMIAEQKLRTQRILGQLIKDGRENGEIRVKGQSNTSCDSKSYDDLGVEAKSAQRWQQIASIPEPAFNEFIETKKAEVQEKAAELTTAGMIRFKKELDKEKRFDTEDPWSEEERERLDLLKCGFAVTVNQKTMKNLCKYAEENGIFERVDRFSDWGNPFELNKDGDRETVCDSYEVYFDLKKSLHHRIESLQGKALACWCHPNRCHAHHLELLINRTYADKLHTAGESNA
jgi:hypothetical protein